MELLQKALFNLPRVADHSGRSLDKLALSQLYGANSAAVAAAAAAAGAGAHMGNPMLNSLGGPGSAANQLLNSMGVEPVSPNLVFEVASLVLYASHAIPVRIKILMDRLFSVLGQDEVTQILKGFGWSLEDYQRGYILKDSRGAPLDRWHMCSKEEEPFVLQQFLRFGETRPITQQLLLQELTEKSNEEQRARAQMEIKKLIERNAMAALASAANPQSQNGPRPPHLHNNNNNGHPPQYMMRNSSTNNMDLKDRGDLSPVGSHPSPGGHDGRSASVSSPSNASSSAMVSPGGPGAGHLSHPLSSPPTSSTPSSINGTGLPPSSPLSSSSPLNRLQNMQPFDYRKAGERKTPDPRDHRGAPQSMRLPPSSMAAAAAAAAGLGMPLMPNVSIPHSLASYHNSMSSIGKAHHEFRMKSMTSGGDENSHSALNLSNSGSGSGRGEGRHTERERERRRAPSSPLSITASENMNQEMKKKFRDNLGVSFVSPTTGKKRVQCNVCLKTFCDKGALKIHFSAVHLREMHKCTVDGCNMLFSSRRSRNRHSANPNPKLHTPHLRRKISPHDGRTHQGPFLPGLAVAMASQQQQQQHQQQQQQQQQQHPPKGFPAPHHLANSPFAMLPPEFHELHRHQAELQRLHEMSKMNSMYANRHHDSDKRDSPISDIAAKRSRFSDSDNEIDDAKSIGNQSIKDETSSGTQSAVGGGRKRKNQNPTRITTTAQKETTDHPGEEEGFSSDDDDEGFENPLDDNDSGDDLADSGDEDEDDDRLGGSGGSTNHRGGSERSPPRESRDKSDHDSEDKNRGNDSQKNGNSSPSDALEKDDSFNNNLLEQGESKVDDLCSEPASPASQQEGGLLLGDIPVDKENPNRCVECRQEFSNHFELKQHFQNVHLNLMHKCTVEGCNAGFPSKRSRDRHSSNFNLHRKLLSTTSEKSEKPASIFSPVSDEQAKNSAAAMYQSELLARLYAEQRSAMEGNTQQANFMKKMESDFPGLAGLPFPGLFGPMGPTFPGLPQNLMASSEKLRHIMGMQQEVTNHS